MRARLSLILLLLLTLAGCGWQGQGVVAEKTFSEGYDYYTFQCSSWDSKGNCIMQMPIFHHVPDSYGYKIRDSNGDIHDVATTKGDWESHKVGDHFDNRTKQK